MFDCIRIPVAAMGGDKYIKSRGSSTRKPYPPIRHIWTIPEQQDILDRVANGETPHSIAEIYKERLHYSSLEPILRKIHAVKNRGVIPPPPIWTTEEEIMLEDMKGNGCSTAEISQAVGHSTNGVAYRWWLLTGGSDENE